MTPSYSFHWETKQDGVTHYIYIDYHQVIVGSHHGSGHTDNASTCSYNDFFDGKFHNHITQHFGSTTLSEVEAAVISALDYPPYQRQRGREDLALSILEQIPPAPWLAEIPKHPLTEKGYLNYGNAGGYKTVVESDTLKITIERDQGFLEPLNGGEQIHFQLVGHASDVIALHDHFFLNINSDYAVLAPNGQLLEKETNIFGDDLRIGQLFKNQETICFGYSWFDGVNPRGWLRYELGKGFTGHWQKQ